MDSDLQNRPDNADTEYVQAPDTSAGPECTGRAPQSNLTRHPAFPYVVPFLVFLGFLAVSQSLPGLEGLLYPMRVMCVAVCTIACSWSLLSLRPERALWSLLLGACVFVIWILPDLAWPGYRGHWLFNNALVGSAQSSLPAGLKAAPLFLVFRAVGTALLVPVVEELFWRGWMMRWLIHPRFEQVPLGAFTWRSFWLTALLFGVEHGPYWDVGLAAGVAYNWWLVRTKSLADCILAHGVTNACLAAYVLRSGQWQYWL